jgi:hypothetical protein
MSLGEMCGNLVHRVLISYGGDPSYRLQVNTWVGLKCWTIRIDNFGLAQCSR